MSKTGLKNMFQAKIIWFFSIQFINMQNIEFFFCFPLSFKLLLYKKKFTAVNISTMSKIYSDFPNNTYLEQLNNKS